YAATIRCPRGHDISARPCLGQQPQDGNVGVGLNGVGRDMRHVLKGGVEAPKLADQARMAVDIAWRSDSLRNFPKRDGFAVELPVQVPEIRHSAAPPRRGPVRGS